jgi:hypothetical protein
MGVAIVIHKLHLGGVFSTDKHPSGGFIPLVLGDLNGLELVAGRVRSQHFSVLGNSLAHLAGVIQNLETQNDIVLDTETDTHLPLATFLDHHRGLLCLLEVLRGGKLQGRGRMTILENNGEFVDDNASGIILRKDRR